MTVVIAFRPDAWFQARRRSTSSASIAHATTWNASAQRCALGARLATTWAIQPAMSAEMWVELRGAFVAELVEEHLQVGVGAARAGPHQMAGVVVDHDDQVAVPALVGDLVDPDPAQPGEPIDT